MWADFYDPKNELVSVVDKYLHPAYEQCINGLTLSRLEYIDHIIAQKKNIIIQDIDYLHYLEKEDEVFVIYCAKGKNLANSDIEAEVISYYLFQDEKLIKIHGQVRLVKGSASDVDM